MYEWVLAMVNSSLNEGFVFLLPLKEICSQLKKPSVDPTILDIFYLLSNLCFLGKVVEKVVAQKPQRNLDEVDFQDPFQSGFSPGYGTEKALVMFLNDL